MDRRSLSYLKRTKIGIDAEQVDQFQRAKDIGCCEQALCYQLRIEVAPGLPWYQSCHGILPYLSPLLKIRGSSEQDGCDVEKVSGEIDEVPHVAKVCAQTVNVGLEIRTSASYRQRSTKLLFRHCDPTLTQTLRILNIPICNKSECYVLL